MAVLATKIEIIHLNNSNSSFEVMHKLRCKRFPNRTTPEESGTRVSPQKRSVDVAKDDETDAKERHETDGDDGENVESDDKQKLLSRVVIGDKFDWQMTEIFGPERSGRSRALCCPDPTSVYVVPSDKDLVLLSQVNL